MTVSLSRTFFKKILEEANITVSYFVTSAMKSVAGYEGILEYFGVEIIPYLVEVENGMMVSGLTFEQFPIERIDDSELLERYISDYFE